MLQAIAYYLGMILLIGGGIADVLASVGMNRFRNFYLRLHAATVGTIWGAVYPLFGLALIAVSLSHLGRVRFYIAGIAATTAIFLLLTAPVGSHAIAQGAHRSKEAVPEPIVVDRLAEDEEVMRGA